MGWNYKDLRVIRDHNETVCSFYTTTTETTSTNEAYSVGQKNYHRYAVIIYT